MLRWLSDENIKGSIVRGVLTREPHIDLVRVQDVGLMGIADPKILEWAANNNRIVLSNDRETMSEAAFARLRARLTMPGVFLLKDRYPIGQAIEEILIIDACSDQGEWAFRVVYLPLG